MVGLAAGCGSSAPSSSTPSTGGPSTAASSNATPTATGDITVFAAASLSDVFTEVGAAFTKANPQARATLSFDASSALVAQLVQGAPADVFAAADTVTMDKLTATGLQAGTPVVFATNVLSIIVPAGNPSGIASLADLAAPGRKVVLCAEAVPCGRYAKQALDAAKVVVAPVSLEQNVKGVATKVTLGEADAGIVYATDVEAAGDKAAGVAIPPEFNVVARYPAVAIKASKHADTAAEFIRFLGGPEGRAILARHGFGTP